MHARACCRYFRISAPCFRVPRTFVFCANVNFSHKVCQTLDLHINDLAGTGKRKAESGATEEAGTGEGSQKHSSCQLFQRVLHFELENWRWVAHAREKNNFLCVIYAV